MPQIILWEQYLSQRRRWMLTMLSIAIFSLLCVGFMYQQTQAQGKNVFPSQNTDPLIQERYSEYKTKEEIYQILRDKHMNLNDGLAIAHAIIEQSKKTDIPVEMFLGIMRKESNFSVNAVSNNKAMGIMQIHPLTWGTYVKKLNLNASQDDAFKPSVNIMVSAAVLKDLVEKYRNKGYQEPELWDYVLSAYYGGEESVRSGLNHHHRRYVMKVKQYEGEYSRKIGG